MDKYNEENFRVLPITNYDEETGESRMPIPNLGFPPPKFPNNNPGGSGFPPQPPNFPAPQFPGGNQNYDYNNNWGNKPNKQPGGKNLGAPPNYVPSKNDSGVKTLYQEGPGGMNLKSVSPNQISFCLYKFTYIWQRNGRSYWAYLTNVDRYSISGLRWMGYNWAYFGLDLKYVDSFVCYRCDDTNNTSETRGTRENIIENIGKEYSLDDTKEVYSRVLAFVDLPEKKDDFIVETIGLVNETEIKSKFPCIKTRNCQYRLTLEVSFPDNLDTKIKSALIEAIKSASNEANDVITDVYARSIYDTPLEVFNESVNLADKSLHTFANALNGEFKNSSDLKDLSRKVRYRIKKDKLTNNWEVSY